MPACGPIAIATAGEAGAHRQVHRGLKPERSPSGRRHHFRWIPIHSHRRGLVLEYSVADNLILGDQHHYATGVRHVWTLDGRRIEVGAGTSVMNGDGSQAQVGTGAEGHGAGNG